MLLILFLLLTVMSLTGAFLFGFGIGHHDDELEHTSRLTALRLQSLEAQRRLHDLTRDAFVAMTEAAGRSTTGSTSTRASSHRSRNVIVTRRWPHDDLDPSA